MIESDVNGKFCTKNGNLIIRNMVEQLIEFLYLLKHTELINEYFGENISQKLSEEVLDLSKTLEKLCFVNKRKTVTEMSKNIEQHKSNFSFV